MHFEPINLKNFFLDGSLLAEISMRNNEIFLSFPGLNLISATTVVFAELYWNPGVTWFSFYDISVSTGSKNISWAHFLLGKQWVNRLVISLAFINIHAPFPTRCWCKPKTVYTELAKEMLLPLFTCWQKKLQMMTSGKSIIFPNWKLISAHL